MTRMELIDEIIKLKQQRGDTRAYRTLRDNIAAKKSLQEFDNSPGYCYE